MRFVGSRILIVLHGSIGDVTRALPLANLLRRAYPKAKLSWSIEAGAYPLIENHPAVDEVLLFERKLWWKGLAPFLAKIRSRNFDLVLDLQRILKSGLISWWTRAPVRLGFHRHDSKEMNWMFNNFHIEAVGDGISKLRHYLKFAEFLGIEPAPVEWKIQCSSQEEQIVNQRLRGIGERFAVFFIGARWESKRWFAYQAALSASEVHKRFGLDIILLGGAEEVPLAQEMERYRLTPLRSYVGINSLRESIAMLARAKVAVGPDTGLMHLSAALGVPVVSLWGATQPRRTGPFGFDHLALQGKADCAPCYLRKCPIGRICMQSIQVEDIVAKVGDALGRSG